jgi:hypothetical protein
MSKPTYVFNLEGVLFYTDATENLQELGLIAGMGAAYQLKEWLKKQRFPSLVSPEPTMAFGYNVARNTAIMTAVVIVAIIPVLVFTAQHGG